MREIEVERTARIIKQADHPPAKPSKPNPSPDAVGLAIFGFILAVFGIFMFAAAMSHH